MHLDQLLLDAQDTPMPEIRLIMPGKYSATIDRDRPTASKLRPPR
jgi:hypothetical protein